MLPHRLSFAALPSARLGRAAAGRPRKSVSAFPRKPMFRLPGRAALAHCSRCWLRNCSTSCCSRELLRCTDSSWASSAAPSPLPPLRASLWPSGEAHRSRTRERGRQCCLSSPSQAKNPTITDYTTTTTLPQTLHYIYESLSSSDENHCRCHDS